MTTPIDASVDGRRTLRTITWAKVFRVTRNDGGIIRWTDHDGTLEFDEEEDGVLRDYTPEDAPSWESSRQEQGTAEGTASLNGTVEASGTVDVTDIRTGLWDRSDVDIWVVDWRYPWLGSLTHEKYTLHDTKRSGELWEPEIQTVIGDLDRKVGRIYTRHCDADLYDSRCGVTKTPVNGTVSAVSGWSDAHPRQRFRTNLTEGDGYYRHGTLTWTSGNNAIAGQTEYDVKYYANSNGEVELWTETPYDIEIGDGFAAAQGCGKAFHRDCDDDFSNSLNYRGFPWMPTARRTLKTPDSH